MRLRTNPELINLLNTKPDVFAYGEVQTPSSHDLKIDEYICFLLKSTIASPSSHRRGIAIFILEKYRFVFTKVYASKTFDIVWMRFKTAKENLHFCFFLPLVPITPSSFVCNFMIFLLLNSKNLLLRAKCILLEIPMRDLVLH